MSSRFKRYGVNTLLVLGVYILIKMLINGEVINMYYEGILLMIGINIILAASLNLTTGFLGQLALGHAGFMAIGAYSAALFTLNTTWETSDVVLLIVSLIIGGLVAGIFGFLVGVPALRLQGDYLGIITLGFGEMIRVLLINMDITGGPLGLRGIPMLTNIDNVFWVTVIVIAIIFSFMNSRHGRNIISIRENEIAAESVGVPTSAYKIYTFIISAFFAGIAGGLFAHYMTVLDPKKFDFMFSIEMLVIVVFGGMGSITGSIVAAIILTVLPELLRDFSDYRLLIYSVLLIAIMLFKPSGLFGTKEFSLFKKKRSREDVRTEGLGGED